ncbi:MAG: DoxX family protein [Bacteroidota bacterium]|nr:DoxX family protein [Bacteroidota bacterium]
MKKINILYWTFTGLFALTMFFSGVQNALVTPESVTLLTAQLGYPEYIIAFLGVAKILGAIAILVPGYPTLKEWAYAGLFFDLLGATYSSIMIFGAQPAQLGMLIFFGLLALSYIFYRKRKHALASQVMGRPVAA